MEEDAVDTIPEESLAFLAPVLRPLKIFMLACILQPVAGCLLLGLCLFLKAYMIFILWLH